MTDVIMMTLKNSNFLKFFTKVSQKSNPGITDFFYKYSLKNTSQKQYNISLLLVLNILQFLLSWSW